MHDHWMMGVINLARATRFRMGHRQLANFRTSLESDALLLTEQTLACQWLVRPGLEAASKPHVLQRKPMRVVQVGASGATFGSG
ncbi:unnamed protein product [Soboliphyme baturini]|uniref:ISXo8 transposase n=1 Tax=Soboliphyme baturini TaxID=241478 RepID=A0A183JB50_9BILA|nr:unnamed protein product [Soboliphyme baturini]